jgi:lysophospholipase L1-like esterase
MKWRWSKTILAIATSFLLLQSGNGFAKNKTTGNKIVAFGDSITAGYPYLKVGNGCTNCGGYELFLQYYLDWDGQGSKVYNYGSSGEYLTFSGINRISSVLASARPNYVLFMEGTNDLSAYVDPATVAYNVYYAAYKVLAAGAKPIVGLITPDTRYGSDWKRVGKTNNYIKNYVGSTPLMCLSDQNSGLAPYWNSGYNYDKLHPNYYGYWIMGIYWYYALHSCS